MSVWPNAVPVAPVLCGVEGELINIRVSIDPRLLEDLLDCLAQVSFPINPQIYHGRPTVVEFPAYEGKLREVREILGVHGFSPRDVQVRHALEV
jgi:hypothetical protein